MDPGIVLISMLVLLMLMIFLGVPVAFGLGIAGIIGIVLIQGTSSLAYMLGSYPINRVLVFSFTALPMFIAMGQFSYASGVASDAYDLANKWFGRLKGGLCLVTIGACGIIGTTTGSGSTGTVAMGKIAIPEMKKYGYDMKLAMGTVAAAGTVGAMIPPSTPLLVYGILTYVSIGKLFIAGILPGILTCLVYMATVYVRCTFNPKLAKVGEHFSWKEKISALSKGWGAVVLFGVVMGGLYLGIATPTQIGALGSFIALVLALLAISRGKSNWGILKSSVVEAAKLCGMVFAFLVGAGIFSMFITTTGLISQMVAFFSGLQIPRMLIFVMIIAIYIPLGMFLDPMSMILITVPIVYPIIVSGLGFNGILYGILLVNMIELAAITPPVGFGLYVINGLYPEEKLSDIIRGSFPFMIADLAICALLIAFPPIALWLPSLMK